MTNMRDEYLVTRIADCVRDFQHQCEVRWSAKYKSDDVNWVTHLIEPIRLPRVGVRLRVDYGLKIGIQFKMEERFIYTKELAFCEVDKDACRVECAHRIKGVIVDYHETNSDFPWQNRIRRKPDFSGAESFLTHLFDEIELERASVLRRTQSPGYR